MATALSYANVVIDFKFKSEVFELPPAHWMALFSTQLKTLQEEVNVLKKQISKDLPAIETTISEQDHTEVAFIRKSDKKIIMLKKHKKRLYRDEEDMITTIMEGVKSLHSNGLVVNGTTLGKDGLGFG